MCLGVALGLAERIIAEVMTKKFLKFLKFLKQVFMNFNELKLTMENISSHIISCSKSVI